MNFKNPVFLISLIITVALIVLGIALPEAFGNVTTFLLHFLTDKFSWLYLLAMFIFVGFALFMALSKYGKIKLGDDDSVPEYSNFSWFAMLCGSGIGIGLIFWGVTEPMNHYVTFGMDQAAADMAIQKSFMHWGLHPWAGYAVVGMALAYFQYRRKAPGLISSIFVPLLGEERVRGPIGKLIDILAIFATIAGVATSFGQAALQLNAGLNSLFGIPQELMVQIVIVALLTALFIFFSLRGIDKGIKVLSNTAMALAGVLLVAVLILGPIVTDMSMLVNGIGDYLGNFFQNSLGINSLDDNSWLGGWTVFYWAWWIAWGPFVGTFIARISKGRTIREFVLGVMFGPTALAVLWFAAFGGLGITQDGGVILSAIAQTENALFVVFSQYPIGIGLTVIACVALCAFFATSANSATFVLSMYSSNGDLNPKKSLKVLWGILLSTLSLILLMTVGLDALKASSIIAAFPFIFVMLLCCVCLYKAISKEVPRKLTEDSEKPIPKLEEDARIEVEKSD